MNATVDRLLVRRAVVDDVPALATLFAAYQGFYGCGHPFADVRAYVATRIGCTESVMFVARGAGELAGFAQVTITSSSLGMAPALVLDDLFVEPASRNTGVGRALLRAVTALATSLRAVRIELVTERTNARARRFYEKAGFVEDTRFMRYEYIATRS